VIHTLCWHKFDQKLVVARRETLGEAILTEEASIIPGILNVNTRVRVVELLPSLRTTSRTGELRDSCR